MFSAETTVATTSKEEITAATTTSSEETMAGTTTYGTITFTQFQLKDPETDFKMEVTEPRARPNFTDNL